MTDERPSPERINALIKNVESVKHLSSKWPWSDLTDLVNEIKALRTENEMLEQQRAV